MDWEQFSQALKECRWEYVLLSMLLGAGRSIRGIRWRMLLEPFDPSTSAITTFNAYNICMAVNLVLPRAGEVARLGYVVRHSAVGEDGKRLLTFDKALGTLLIERVWDALVTLGMAAVLVVVKWDDFGAYLVEAFRPGRQHRPLVGAGRHVPSGRVPLACYSFREKAASGEKSGASSTESAAGSARSCI